MSVYLDNEIDNELYPGKKVKWKNAVLVLTSHEHGWVLEPQLGEGGKLVWTLVSRLLDINPVG